MIQVGNRIADAFHRIADALTRIAAALEAQPPAK